MRGYNFLDIQAFAAAIYKNRALLMVPYGYTATFTSIAQGATQSSQLSITANADFILTGLRYRAAISAAQTISTKTAAFCRLLIVDSGSNEQFTNSAVDLENYAQNGQDDRGLAFPRFIQGRTSLSLTLTNCAPTAETYSTVDIFFDGVLVRAVGG